MYFRRGSRLILCLSILWSLLLHLLLLLALSFTGYGLQVKRPKLTPAIEIDLSPMVLPAGYAFSKARHTTNAIATAVSKLKQKKAAIPPSPPAMAANMAKTSQSRLKKVETAHDPTVLVKNDVKPVPVITKEPVRLMPKKTAKLKESLHSNPRVNPTVQAKKAVINNAVAKKLFKNRSLPNTSAEKLPLGVSTATKINLRDIVVAAPKAPLLSKPPLDLLSMSTESSMFEQSAVLPRALQSKNYAILGTKNRQRVKAGHVSSQSKNSDRAKSVSLSSTAQSQANKAATVLKRVAKKSTQQAEAKQRVRQLQLAAKQARKQAKAQQRAHQLQLEAEKARKQAEAQQRARQLQLAAERASVLEASRLRYQQQLSEASAVLKNHLRQFFTTPDSKQDWRVVLAIDLHLDGTVDDVRVVESSKIARYDRLAVSTVHKAAPLPLPKDPKLRQEMLHIDLTFSPQSILAQ